MNQDQLLKDLHAIGTPVGIALAEILRRTGWIAVSERMPERQQTVLLWLKGGDHAAMATMNIDLAGVRYFLLANSGTWRRALDEVSHWMPLPAGPDGTNRSNPRRDGG